MFFDLVLLTLITSLSLPSRRQLSPLERGTCTTIMCFIYDFLHPRVTTRMYMIYSSCDRLYRSPGFRLIGAEPSKRSHHSSPVFPLATMLSRRGLHQASNATRAPLYRKKLCLCATLTSFSHQGQTAAYSTSAQREGSSS